MKLSEALEGFIISSLAEGYSQATTNTYRSALVTMIEYLGDRPLWEIDLPPKN